MSAAMSTVSEETPQMLAAHEVRRGQEVFVDAFPYVGKQCFVKTKHRQVMQCIKRFKRDLEIQGRAAMQSMYRSIFTAAIEADVDVIYDKAAEGDTMEWQNFCDDIVLLAALRHLLFGAMIEIIPIDKKELNVSHL